MRILGEFNAAVSEANDENNPKPEPSGFKLAGEVFYVDPEMSFIPFGTFAQAAVSGLDTADMEGAAAIMDIMRDLIAANPETKKTKENEWARFKQVASQSKIKMEVILEIISAVFSGESGRPTQQPSDSPPGSLPTATSQGSSTSVSRSRGSGGKKRRPAKATVQRLGPPADMEPVTEALIAEMGG